MQTVYGCNLDVASALIDSNVIFWDFDGVIKDTVGVKSKAYEQLFLPFGQDVSCRVKRHHEINGGVSRFDKIPLYLSWAGETTTQEQVEKFCSKFSQSVLQAVVDATWVPGVREYLLKNFSWKYFVLVTATPQNEIERILVKLGISHCFREVYGAPTDKAYAIKVVLSCLEWSPVKALMIGDTENDLNAALANSIPFLLRRTSFNLPLQSTFEGLMFDSLNNE